MVPKFFAGVDVGDVGFDHRQIDSSDGVAQGNAVVGVSPCVEDDAVCPVARIVDRINESAFGVGLERGQLNVVFAGILGERLGKVV